MSAITVTAPARRDMQFQRLRATIPLHLRASGIPSGPEVQLSGGSAAEAVIAAAATPGMLSPVDQRGLLLADGGSADDDSACGGGP